MVRGVLLAGVALSLGCFTPVGEPEYWERQRRWGDGGRIWVDEPEGGGAHFHVWLPGASTC